MTQPHVFFTYGYSLIKWIAPASLFMVLATGCTSQPQVIESIPSISLQPSEAEVSTNPSKMALAQHLQEVDAKMYGAYWCGYCHQQLALFGEEAANMINEIECDPNGKNARPDLCRQAGITGFPTWEINGQLYPGLQSLDDLADLSGYQGNRTWN